MNTNEPILTELEDFEEVSKDVGTISLPSLHTGKESTSVLNDCKTSKGGDCRDLGDKDERFLTFIKCFEDLLDENYTTFKEFKVSDYDYRNKTSESISSSLRPKSLTILRDKYENFFQSIYHKMESFERDIKSLKDKLKEKSYNVYSRDREDSSDRRYLTLDNSEYTTKLNNLKKKIERLTDKNDELTKKNSEQEENYMKENKKLKKKYKELEEEKCKTEEKLDKEISKLKKEFRNKELELSAQKQSFENNCNKDFEAKVNALIQSIKDKESKEEEKNENFHGELKSIKEVMKTLTVGISMATDHGKEIPHKELENYRKEIEHLKAEITIYRKEEESLNEELENYRKEIEHLKAEITKYRKEEESLKETILMRDKTIEAKDVAFGVITSKLRKFLEDETMYKEKIQQLENANVTLISQKSKIAEFCENKNKAITAMKEKLKRFNNLDDTLEQLAHFQKLYEYAKKQNNEQLNKMESLEIKLKSNDEEFQNLKKERIRLQLEMENMKKLNFKKKMGYEI